MRRTIALCAFALAALPSVASATDGTVEIERCRPYPKLDAFEIVFVNRGSVDVSNVLVRLSFADRVVRVRRSGRFSPGVRIDWFVSHELVGGRPFDAPRGCDAVGTTD